MVKVRLDFRDVRAEKEVVPRLRAKCKVPRPHLGADHPSSLPA